MLIKVLNEREVLSLSCPDGVTGASGDPLGSPKGSDGQRLLAAFGFWVQESHIQPLPAIDHSPDSRAPVDSFQPGGIIGVKGDKKPGMVGGGREWAVPIWGPHSPRVVL